MKHNMPLGMILGALSILAGLAASGCGGGGGGNSNGNNAAATRLRTITPGLRYNYRFSGTVSVGTGSSPTSISGTLLDTFASATLGSRSVIAYNITGTIDNDSTLTIDSTEYLVQDPTTSDLLLVGDTNGNGTVSGRMTTNHATFVPGVFGTATSFDEQQTFDDGSQQRHAFAVQGQETVKVPAGTFATWRCLDTTDDGTSVTRLTEWFAPQLGTFVKSTVQSGDPTQGGVISLTAELTSTNAQ